MGRARTVTSPNGSTDHYRYDAANQLESIRQGSPTGPELQSFIYDDNGNLERKTSSDGILPFTYDGWDQLSHASKTWAHAETYGYDDLGRRVRKSAEQTHVYFYDGLDIAAEFTGGDWTTATGRYVHGPGVDTPLIRVANGAPTYSSTSS